MGKAAQFFIGVFLIFLEGDILSQNISVNTTGAANSTLSMFEVLEISTTANTKGLHVGHSGAMGAGNTGYALYATKTGGAGVGINVGGYFNASGGASNYAGIFDQGYVGIGTTSPGLKLDVVGTGGGTVDLRINGRIQTGDGSGAGGIWLSNASDGFVGNNGGNIGFYTSGAGVGWNAFQIIKASGNVGIGNAAPAAKLHVTGSADVPQMIVRANATQSNTNPLIKLQNSAGTDLLWISADGITNTFIGLNAGRVNTGTNNSFMGSNSGYSNTSGVRNTAMGFDALYTNVVSNDNTAVGTATLRANTYAQYNVAIGNDALFTQSYANGNALYDGANVAVGYRTLYLSQPTATTSGAYGAGILFNMREGTHNTAVGYKALSVSTSGAANVAVGALSLVSNTTGYNNAACGDEVLNRNTTGDSNTGMGVTTLYFNTIGWENSALGRSALAFNVNGNYNTAAGVYACYSNTSGSRNTGVGKSAVYSNQTGNFNTGVGQWAISNTTTSNNTAIGYQAGVGNATGANNIYVGYNAHTAAANYNNSIILGYNYNMSASNTIILGNASIGSLQCQVGLSGLSDKRIKDDVKENVPGLVFINSLRPVTYHFNIHRQNEMLGIKDSIDWDEKYDIEKVQFTGFIAQEVETAAKKIGYDFSGVDVPKDKKNLYGLRYAEFVVPLVKSVQELSAQNEAQQKTIEKLTKELDEVKELIRKK